MYMHVFLFPVLVGSGLIETQLSLNTMLEGTDYPNHKVSPHQHIQCTYRYPYYSLS